MERFSVNDLRWRAAVVLKAALRAPVAVTHNGCDRFVVLSINAFAQLQNRGRQVISMPEIPSELLSDLEQPYQDAEQEILNHLLED